MGYYTACTFNLRGQRGLVNILLVPIRSPSNILNKEASGGFVPYPVYFKVIYLSFLFTSFLTLLLVWSSFENKAPKLFSELLGSYIQHHYKIRSEEIPKFIRKFSFCFLRLQVRILYVKGVSISLCKFYSHYDLMIELSYLYQSIFWTSLIEKNNVFQTESRQLVNSCPSFSIVNYS